MTMTRMEALERENAALRKAAVALEDAAHVLRQRLVAAELGLGDVVALEDAAHVLRQWRDWEVDHSQSMVDRNAMWDAADDAIRALDALLSAQQPETRAVDVVTLGLMQSTRKSQPDYMACAEPEQEDPPPHHHRHRAPAS